MGKLRGDWRDLFSGFVIALDVRKQVLALTGALLIALFICIPTPHWALRYDPALAAEFEERGPASYVLLVPEAIAVLFRQEGCVGFWWILFALTVFTAVWSLFGGAISRIAAVEIAREDRIRTQEALAFAWRKYASNFSSLIACILGFLFFAGLIWAASLPARIPAAGPWLGLVLAVVFPLALLMGFIATLIAIGTVFGFPLFYPAVAAEGTDAFDAISRGFSYVYSRPWHALAYLGVTLVHGAISTAFIYAFGVAMLAVTCGAVRLGMGPKFDPVIQFALGQLGYAGVVEQGGTGLGWMAILVTTWLLLTAGLTLSYALSYLQSQLTMIYFLLRLKVDELPMNYVFEEKEEGEAAAAAERADQAPAPPEAEKGGDK